MIAGSFLPEVVGISEYSMGEYEILHHLIIWAYTQRVEISYAPRPGTPKYSITFREYHGKPGRVFYETTNELTQTVLEYCEDLHERSGHARAYIGEITKD